MVSAISYAVAMIITLGLAIFLYPIAGIFWVFGLLGRISDILFAFTTNLIKNLWKDIENNNNNNNAF